MSNGCAFSHTELKVTLKHVYVWLKNKFLRTQKLCDPPLGAHGLQRMTRIIDVVSERFTDEPQAKKE